jgi:dipeptidyl aminopeptidase/acylaminoacyl peptidase
MYTKPELFAAGIAGAGPTEWENYNSWYSGRTIGKVDRTKPVLRKYSLLPLARQLKHPLMLVHGMQDPNVLYQDTVNVYRELLDSGKDALVELYLDPDGVHGLGGTVKPAGLHRKYEAFWLQHLGQAQ